MDRLPTGPSAGLVARDTGATSNGRATSSFSAATGQRPSRTPWPYIPPAGRIVTLPTREDAKPELSTGVAARAA